MLFLAMDVWWLFGVEMGWWWWRLEVMRGCCGGEVMLWGSCEVMLPVCC
jgi:hypothetical protein